MSGLKKVAYDAVIAIYVIIAISIFVPWVLLSIDHSSRLFLDISDFVGWFYSHLCHQLPFRSLFYDGIQMPVCARDVSIYIATALGLIFFRLKGFGDREFKINYVLTIFLFLPTAIDGFTQLFGWRESTNELRLITGVPFGIGYAYLIAWALPFVFALLGLISATLAHEDAEADDLIKRIKKMVWPII
jgi:Predicted membrane protein